MKKLKFNTRLIRLTMSYTVQDIVKLYKIHKNTVSHWIKSGLKINDHHKPYLIHGSELKRFLDEKQ